MAYCHESGSEPFLGSADIIFYLRPIHYILRMIEITIRMQDPDYDKLFRRRFVVSDCLSS